MADRGYFLLYRGWRQSDVFKDEPLTEREAWVWLLEEAAYKSRQREIAGKTVSLQRGEVAASLTFLERAWKWPRDRVRWFLTKIEKHGMVTADKRAGITVITVTNYDAYQPARGQNHPTASTTASTTPDTTASPTADGAENCAVADDGTTANPTANPKASTIANPTNENEGLIMKGSKERGGAREGAAPNSEPTKPKRDPPRGTYLPDDWQPKIKHYDLGRSLSMQPTEVEYEADKFRDHFGSASGQAARKRDWDRTFNNWLRKAAEFGKRPAAGKQSTGHRQPARGVSGAVSDLVSGSGR